MMFLCENFSQNGPFSFQANNTPAGPLQVVLMIVLHVPLCPLHVFHVQHKKCSGIS